MVGLVSVATAAVKLAMEDLCQLQKAIIVAVAVVVVVVVAGDVDA